MKMRRVTSLVTIAVVLCVVIAWPFESKAVRYRTLKDQLVSDVESSPSYMLSSNFRHDSHPNYAQIVALGKPVVPLLIADIRINGNRGESCLLADILPHVDVFQLYNVQSSDVDARLYGELWLRWWDSYGQFQSW